MFIITWSSNFLKSFSKFNHNGVTVVYFRRVELTCPGSPGDCVVHMIYKISCYTPLFWEILWSVVIRCLHSIGPVYFMVGNDRLSREPWPHPYHPINNLNHHISNYKLRSRSKQGKNTLNEQKKPVPPYWSKWSEQNHQY